MYKYIELLPEVLQEIEEYKAIGVAVDRQVSVVQLQYEQIFTNRYIDTANEATLARLQKIFSLEHNPSMTVDEQRKQLKARKQVRFIINLQRIRAMVDEITHGDAAVTIDYDVLVLTVKLALSSKHNFNSIKQLLEDTVPANLVLNVLLLYNQYDLLKHFTHARLAEFTHRELRSEVLVFSSYSALKTHRHTDLNKSTHLQLRKGDF